MHRSTTPLLLIHACGFISNSAVLKPMFVILILNIVFEIINAKAHKIDQWPILPS